jgi:hypothetical protein
VDLKKLKRKSFNKKYIKSSFKRKSINRRTPNKRLVRKPLNNSFNRKRPSPFAPRSKRVRPNIYSRADLGSGVSYYKFNVEPAPSADDPVFTPSRIRRLIAKAVKDDFATLSSSFVSSSDIFYKFNNVAIYLRRPHTINEMFETSSIRSSSTYNSEVIEEFYTSRF